GRRRADHDPDPPEDHRAPGFRGRTSLDRVHGAAARRGPAGGRRPTPPDRPDRGGAHRLRARRASGSRVRRARAVVERVAAGLAAELERAVKFQAQAGGQITPIEVRGEAGRYTIVLDGETLTVDARQTGEGPYTLTPRAP